MPKQQKLYEESILQEFEKSFSQLLLSIKNNTISELTEKFFLRKYFKITLTVDEWKELCEAIKENKSLESIKLIDYLVSYVSTPDIQQSEDYINAESHNNFPEDLEFSEIAFDRYTKYEMIEIFNYLSEALAHHSRVKHIHLESSSMNDTHAEILAKLFKRNTSIISIAINKNHIENAGLQKIIQAIADNPNSAVEKVNFYYTCNDSYSSLDEERIIELFDSIKNMLQRHPKIFEFKISFRNGSDLPGDIKEITILRQLQIKNAAKKKYLEYVKNPKDAVLPVKLHQYMKERPEAISYIFRHANSDKLFDFASHLTGSYGRAARLLQDPAKKQEIQNEQEYWRNAVKNYSTYLSNINNLIRNRLIRQGAMQSIGEYEIDYVQDINRPLLLIDPVWGCLPIDMINSIMFYLEEKPYYPYEHRKSSVQIEEIIEEDNPSILKNDSMVDNKSNNVDSRISTVSEYEEVSFSNQEKLENDNKSKLLNQQQSLLPPSRSLFIATGALTLASTASFIAYKALSTRINNVLFNRFLIAGSALTAVFAVGAGICAGVAKHQENKLKSDDLRQASEGQERI